MTHNLCGSKRVARAEPTKHPEFSVESRALARQLADGADGSAAAGRMWKRLIKVLAEASHAEIKEHHRAGRPTDPDKRQFLPKEYGPCSVALDELREAMNADHLDGEPELVYTVTPRPPVKAGLRRGHAVQDWWEKYFGKSEATEGATNEANEQNRFLNADENRQVNEYADQYREEPA